MADADDIYMIDPNSIWLEPVDNGFILHYSREYKVGMGMYDSMTRYKDCPEVYKPSEGSKAIARMQELYKVAGKMMVEEDDDEGDDY